MKSVKAYIPATLNVDELIELYPLPKPLKRDKLIYLIHLIHVTPFLHPESYYKGMWVTLHSKKLEKIISNYRDYFKHLFSVGLVEEYNQYIPGTRSKGYRFVNLKHIVCHSQEIELTDKTLLNAIKKNKVAQKKSREKENKIVERKMEYLTKWFNPKLRINFPEDYSALVTGYYNNTINDGDYHFKIDDFGRRLHTPITNLKKKYRDFLIYDDERLVEVDIQTSQPFLLIKLLIDEVVDKSPKFEYELENIHTNHDKINLVNSYAELEGLGQFLEDVLLNDLYSVIKEVYYKERGMDISRELFKQPVFEFLFGKTAKNHPLYMVFQERYPFVVKYLESIKENDYREISRRLQRFESNLILKKVCNEISKERPDMPIFTIHDSILTTESNVDYLKWTMIRVITKEVGFEPTLSNKPD